MTTTSDWASNDSLLALYSGVLVFYVTSALAFVGIFRKADTPMWAAFVPVFNWYVLLKVVGRPGWWLIGLLIPCVGFFFFIVVMFDLAQSFGRGTAVTVGLVLLSVVFMLVLGFGRSRYEGPAAGPSTAFG